jgi:aminocarboxymuconate-semialdehyde decarboxylase
MKGNGRKGEVIRKIDIHNHIEIPEALELLPEKPLDTMAPRPEDKSYTYTMDMFASLTPKLGDPFTKIDDLRKMGLDMAVLSIAPTQFFYNLQSDAALKVCRFQNDRIALLVKQFSDKFAGMANVPLQDESAATAELERAIGELGLAGVEIGSNVNGTLLGSPRFLPFFEKASSLDVPIFIHPHNPMGMERLKDYYSMNIIGFPFDTTLTAGSLIFSGIFDQFPGLKIILSHSGGFLPYIIGRMDHAFKTRPECRDIRKSPFEYLKMFYFDTIIHGTEQLQYLISVVGTEHVLLGTDYPYDMGDLNPLESIHGVKKLSIADAEKISGRNAQMLFKL